MEKLIELKDLILIPSNTNLGNFNSKLEYLVNDANDLTGISRSLPLFTCPTESIIDSSNWKVWQNNYIKPILPLNEKLETRLEACCSIFSSFTIQEVKSYFLDQNRRNVQSQFHICLINSDNGHDTKLIELGHKLKQIYGQQILLMAGNILNPEIYIAYTKSGFDYVRVGIPKENTKFGFYYPIGSLLSDLSIVRSKACIGLKTPKIIADININDYSDIVKALAIGADYCMLGKDFCKLLESTGTVYRKAKDKSGNEIIEEVRDMSAIMSSPKINIKNLGLIRQYFREENTNSIKVEQIRYRMPKPNWTWVDIETDVETWVNGLKDCIDYSFTMCGSSNWDDFRKNVKIGKIN